MIAHVRRCLLPRSSCASVVRYGNSCFSRGLSFDKHKREEMNMCQAINSAMGIALESKKDSVLFGEDVAFGGVFRCSVDLRDRFGPERVFNAPVAEQGIVAFAIGLAVTGYDVIAEIQFADYIFPAFDQIVNEAAKYRYRTASHFHCGGLTIRAPCSAVGHGSMYHSQSVESYFAHCPGLKIVVPRGPVQAKGLLLSAIRDPNPVLFFEPKILYRTSVESVPVGDYELPLGKAEVVRAGKHITMVGWGTQVNRMLDCATRCADEGIECEVIDLQTVVPWDRETVVASVKKTGRCIVTHEAQQTNGFGAEISSSIQEQCFLSLEAPIQRVTGFDIHFPLAYEEFMLPNTTRLYDAVKKSMSY